MAFAEVVLHENPDKAKMASLFLFSKWPQGAMDQRGSQSGKALRPFQLAVR